jgi:Flp pilus assembly protein TadG
MRNPLSNLCRRPSWLTALVADQRGTSAVILALSLTGIIGTAGLGTEVAAWYMQRQTMQGAADAASFTAATALQAGATVSQIRTEAQSVIASYKIAGSSPTVTVNSPPTTGTHTTNATAVEIVISQQQSLLLSGMFVSAAPTVTTRSVAAGTGQGTGCVLALDRGDAIDVTDSGNTTVNLSNCALYINSNDASGALTMSGGAVINASAAYIVGGVSESGGSVLNTTKGTFTGSAPLNDPYGSVPIPTYSGCTQNNYKLTGSNSDTLSAGASPYVFCNGLSMTGSSTLTLNPGVYVIDRGSLSMAGGTTLNATGGVTLVLTSSTGSNYATTSIGGGAIVNITAPTTGTTAGLAFYQDRNAPNSGTDSISGGGSQNINGAIYFPSQQVTYAGNSSSTCTQLVAWKMKFTGNATFNNTCSAYGTQSIGPSSVKIVE